MRGSDEGDRRATQRRQVDLAAVIVVHGTRRSCRLVNLSENGALVAAPLHPRVGDKVTVEAEGRSVAATVSRVTSSYFAITFAEPFPSAR